MAEAAQQTFNLRTVVVMVIAGIVAFIAFLLLLAYAGDLKRSMDGRAHAQSVAATGFAGLAKLIDATGGEARMIRDDAELATGGLVVATLEPGMDAQAIQDFVARRDGGLTLLVLPKWATMADPAKAGWVKRVERLPAESVAAMLEKLGAVTIGTSTNGRAATTAGKEWLEDSRFRVPASAQTIAGKEILPLVTAPDGKALLGLLGDESTYILAEPDLLNNMAMKDPATARQALDILEALADPEDNSVRFDVTLNGFGKSPSPLKLLFEPPFVVLTISLFLATLLAGLQGAVRFGPLATEERALALGKTALVENSAGLLRMTQREHRAGSAYADLIRDAAGHDAGAPIHLSGAELEAYLDRMSAPSGGRFTDLRRLIDEATNKHLLLEYARALFSWKKGLVR